MLIEFLGLPGCGKSTLARLVGDHLKEQGLRVKEPTYILDHQLHKAARRRTKFRLLTSFSARNPRTALADLLIILRTRQASLSDMQKASFNWLYISCLATGQPASPVVTLLDQGIAQAVWSIALAARRETWVDLLAQGRWRNGGLPDLVVSVHADLATIGERLDARTTRVSRMDHLGHDLHALRRGEAICGVIATTLRAMRVPVIDIVSNEAPDLATGAHRVSDVILTALRNYGSELATEQARALGIDAGAISRCGGSTPASTRRINGPGPRARTPTSAQSGDKGV
jgi:hypothetical protein